ncbi:unnamed protein product [Alternaria alternata]
MKSTTIFLVFGSMIGTQAALTGRGLNSVCSEVPHLAVVGARANHQILEQCQLESKIITLLKSSYAQAARTTTVTASCTPPAVKAKRDEIIKSTNGKSFIIPDGTPEKRTAPPTPSCPAPLKYLAAQAVSSICSCIVTPTTKTSTVVQTFPATTSTATAPTSTMTVAAPIVLVTSTTTNTVVITTTTTITSTTTTPAATATVVPVVAGGGSCGCSYISVCGTQYVDTGAGVYITQASSLQQCIQQCDENFSCNEYSFQYSTGVCTQLHGGYNAVANADFASGSIDASGGRCPGVCATAN